TLTHETYAGKVTKRSRATGHRAASRAVPGFSPRRIPGGMPKTTLPVCSIKAFSRSNSVSLR
ncbi:hypothetical protein, partial [Actinomadura sp. GC306]|uniref:hypothetical protein n=1 Tax=Actinomadura sp. GC306 TaxID=2530367 RepID=UPI001A9E4ED3